MGILDEDVQRVRAASDLVAIASEHLGLRRVGRRHVGLCPFHAERTPSFSVNAEEGLFYCFGCQAKGDVITFVRDVQHLDFVGAVEFLAGRAGITLRYDDVRETGERRRRSLLLEALEAAAGWYHQRLLTSPDAARARGYLRSRGYDGEIVRRYRMGWAPDDWDALSRAIDAPPDVLVDAGLAFRNRRNRLQDAFRARVLFPILDVRGAPVAFGGRILPGADGPKYKNSPQTAVYDKSAVLYGLNWAKADVVAAGEVVVCEGYTDVVGMAAAGVDRAVATCGTALTERHVTTLANFAKRLVLAFDADAAGQGAADRVYEWERAHDLDVAVAALPVGADPADLARQDPAALRKAVEGAVPFLRFRVDRVLGGADLSTAEGRARAAEAVLPIVAEHPSELVRDQYLMELADRCRISVERLRSRAAGGGAPLAGGRPTGTAPSSPSSRGARRRPDRESPELEALRLAVHRPEAVADALDEVLFADPVHLAAYRALAGAATLHEAIEAADPDAADLVQRLAVEEEPDTDPADAVVRLVEEAARRTLAALQAEMRASDDPMAYAAEVGWLKLRCEALRSPAPDLAVAGHLVAWLAGRGEEGA